jgi:menaquinone-dependent protoporphyrinogen oxidase
MKSIAVLYATREGQTRRIAEHVAATIGTYDLAVDVIDVALRAELFSPELHGAALLAASVHRGKHEPEMVAFVKRRRADLELVPSAFLSVSLTEATAEDGTQSPDARRKAEADVKATLEAFFKSTGWRPAKVLPVAGALLYSHYNLIERFLMKHMARQAGGPTDVTHDYEFTDWPSLDRFIGDFVTGLPASVSAAG